MTTQPCMRTPYYGPLFRRFSDNDMFFFHSITYYGASLKPDLVVRTGMSLYHIIQTLTPTIVVCPHTAASVR